MLLSGVCLSKKLGEKWSQTAGVPGQQVKLLLVITRVPVCILPAPLLTQLLANLTKKTEEDGLNVWVSAVYVADPDGVSVS